MNLRQWNARPSKRTPGAVRVTPILAAVWCVSSLGCMNPQFTRFPTWFTSFPSAENAAYERQLPFPDPDIGPSTEASPRGYERPRSLARRAAEQRLFQGIPVGPESMPSGVPGGARNDSRAVH
jgi:hypothetical protein